MERKKLAEQILEAVGTKDNVVSLVHCMTRLRFTLKDVHKVKEEELKNLPGVLGVTENGGQYQIIIGNEVPKVYQEVTGLLPSAASASSDNEKPVKMNVFLRMVNVLSSCMTPIVPALAGAGILKVILSVLILTNLTTAENQTYYYLSFFADATFYFLPILLAITSAAKFRTNVYLAVTLAGILLHPKFTAVVAAKEPVSLIAIGPLGYYLGYGLAQVIYFLQEIEKAGYSLITPVIISNSDNYLDVIGNTGRWVNSGDVLLSVLGKEDRP
ncbi:PTS transporter subunit EIIB [Lachnospiraceae bacterium 54-53]